MENASHTDYDKVVKRIDGLAERGWFKDFLAEADGYPLFKLENGPKVDRRLERPTLLIDAGIHGEEPAGVLGLLDWLETSADRWLSKIDFTVFPCLNPWGFERGIRYDPRGKDLNREFNNPVHPAVVSFCDAIAGRRFDLLLDLHEDCDFHGMYLFEVLVESATRSATPTLGRTILDACRDFVPLSDGEDIGGLSTQDGMVAGSITREELDDWDEWPIALYAFVHHTDAVVTVETPGKQPLDLRRRLHGLALDIVCERLTKGTP